MCQPLRDLSLLKEGKPCSAYPFFSVEPRITDLRGQLPTSGIYPWRSLPAIKFLAIHHTAGSKRDFTAQEIAEYHVNVKGWPGIGYAYLLHWDGSIDWCQDHTVMSHHIHDHNHDALGICLGGDWTDDIPPNPMLVSCRWLVGELLHHTGASRVVGHRELAVPGWETACPGETYEAGWKELIGG